MLGDLFFSLLDFEYRWIFDILGFQLDLASIYQNHLDGSQSKVVMLVELELLRKELESLVYLIG